MPLNITSWPCTQILIAFYITIQVSFVVKRGFVRRFSFSCFQIFSFRGVFWCQVCWFQLCKTPFLSSSFLFPSLFVLGNFNFRHVSFICAGIISLLFFLLLSRFASDIYGHFLDCVGNLRVSILSFRPCDTARLPLSFFMSLGRQWRSVLIV